MTETMGDMPQTTTHGSAPLPSPEELVASVNASIGECERVIAERQGAIETHRREIKKLRGRIGELKRMLPRRARAKKTTG